MIIRLNWKSTTLETTYYVLILHFVLKDYILIAEFFDVRRLLLSKYFATSHSSRFGL